MSTRGPLQVLRRRWISVLVVTLLALLTAVVHVLTAPVVYRSQADVFFSLVAGNSAADLVQGSTYTQNQVESFARLATTPEVLQPVVDELGLDVRATTLARQVEAAVPVGTVIVEITVTDGSPVRSAELADAVATSLGAVVEEVAPANAAGEPTVVATTVSPAEVPSSPASPDVPLAVAVALVAGLVAGCGLAWARDSLDTRVRDAAGVAEVSASPLIGSVPTWSTGDAGRVPVAAAPHSPQAESFRQLRTNLQFLRVPEDPSVGDGRALVLALTSSLPGEGKSTVSSNLAAALAETGARVLLVDADLRRPAVAGVLGMEGAVGLTTVLLGRAAVDEVVQDWGSAGLHVLTSGAVPPNPAELLGSPAMHRLVEDLRRSYDYVLLDTAPLLPVADAAVLSRVVDGTVVVAQAGRVRRHQLAEALNGLEQVSARVLGLVLNRVPGSREEYAYRAGEVSGAGPAVPAPDRIPVA
ncbi:polysaccharide biosynthesis tyrosine autokinase [Geodermatophilus sp. SYSU D00758]